MASNLKPFPQNQRDAPVQADAPKPLSAVTASDYVKSRFNKDNWFGSIVAFSGIYRALQSLMGALTRRVNGEKEPDKIRAFNYSLFAVESTWSFLSGRGGKIPEGNTFLQRMSNALRHPNQSSSQFEYLIALPAQLLSAYNNMTKGLKAYGLGLKAGEKAYGTEKVRLYTALLTIISQYCTGYGHFRKRDADQPEAEHLPEKTGITGMMRKIWDHDRILVMGAALNLVIPSLSFVEGWKKMGKSSEEAKHILQSAIIGIITNLSSSIYVFQRITRSNFERDTPEHAGIPVGEPPMEQEENPGREKRGHAERIAIRQVQAHSSGHSM